MSITLFAAQEGDNDEVRAALVTAASYHRHHQYDHSLRWLRHAAQLAAEAGRTDRSHQLHASARQLDEMVAAPTHREFAPSTENSPDTSRRAPSTIIATHRTPYSYIQARSSEQPRIRLDSPTEINVAASTMRTPPANMRTQPLSDDEPPSLLGHATIQPSIGQPSLTPDTVMNGQPMAHQAMDLDSTQEDDEDEILALLDDELLVVDEPTHSSNPGIPISGIDLGKTVTTVHGSPSSEPAPLSAPIVDEDDVATLTTQAPLRVAVLPNQDGPAQVMLIHNKRDIPDGAMLGLLIPIDPTQLSRLRKIIRSNNDGPESKSD